MPKEKQKKTRKIKVRSVPDFPEYKISRAANVYRNGRKLKPYQSKDGYYCVKLSKNGKVTTGYVHKLLAMAYIPKPEGMEDATIANHIDGDKQHNAISNLEWTDTSGNTQHAFDEKLATPPNGEKNGKAKLSNKDVKKMRKFISKGNTQASAAKKWDVSPALVSRIMGKNAKHDRRQNDGTTRTLKDLKRKIRNECRNLEQEMLILIDESLISPLRD